MPDDIVVKIEQPEEMPISETLPEIAIIEEKLDEIQEDARFAELREFLENEYKNDMRAIIAEEMSKFNESIETRLASFRQDLIELSKLFDKPEILPEPESVPEPEIIPEIAIEPAAEVQAPTERKRFFI